MKFLAKFLLSSVFVFLPAVGCAQVDLGLHEDCGFPPALKVFTVETRTWINNKLIEVVSPQIVETLEDGQNCLNVNLMRLRASDKDLHTQMGWIADSHLETRNDIKDLQDKLKQTELDLHAAETKIETLEKNYDMLNLQLTALTARRPVSKPLAPASKPKAPASKPTPAVKEGTH